MNRIKYLIAAGVLVSSSSLCIADILRLKNGPAVQGALVKANSKEITFILMDGTAETYPVSSVSGIGFAPLPPPPKAAPTPAPASPVVTIPAGTQITVRTIEAIDGKTAKGGMRYRASIDDPVAVGSQAVIPKGASCMLEEVSVKQGDEMALRLRDVNVGGSAPPSEARRAPSRRQQPKASRSTCPWRAG
jgi:hypothetical protein